MPYTRPFSDLFSTVFMTSSMFNLHRKSHYGPVVQECVKISIGIYHSLLYIRPHGFGTRDAVEDG